MKYINLLANTYELNCLFPTAKIKSYKIMENYLISKITLEANNETFELVHYIENVFDKLSNLENILNINSLYTSPIDDLTIICDRKLWSELYFPLMRHHKDIFEKLEKIYVERNVTVFFNFAFLEAVDYEDYEEYFLYDFKFNHPSSRRAKNPNGANINRYQHLFHHHDQWLQLSIYKRRF